MNSKAILLLNMGGPRNLSEVEVFLKNMFNDPCILGIKSPFWRKILASLITLSRKNAAKKNYEILGGSSPINSHTISLCKVMQNLAPKGVFVDFIMNYTPPFASEILPKYKDFDEIILLPLYPHFSQTTIKSSLNACIKELEILGVKNYKICDIFYQNSEYNEIILSLIKEKIASLEAEKIAEISLIFSAHSLPVKIIKNGDPYEKQINEHVKILTQMLEKNGLKFKEIILSYQSRLGPVEWLSPNTGEVLENLASKKALIFPIAFCIDNSETDFELSIEYKKIANERNFEFYEVCKCPNANENFAKFLLNLAI